MKYRVFWSFVFCCFLWCVGIIGAPILKHNGYTGCSTLFYSAYQCVCYQQDSHSFHVFGERFGVCIRCSAIYYSFFISLLAYPLFLRWSKKQRDFLSFVHRVPSPCILWVVLVLMTVDAGLSFWGLHSSTVTSRLATGISLGIILPWFVVPVLVDAYPQLWNNLKRKLSSRGG